MEQLLHYVWKHKLFPLHELHTTDGQTLEVIDTGLHNHNAGPDFFNAKVKVGGVLWVGNVEIHDKSSDWFLHGHDHDPHYDNVVLHVVGVDDGEVTTADGNHPPQLQLEVPGTVRQNYEDLLRTDNYPPCYKIIPQLSSLTVHSWMSTLQTERLEQKTEAIKQRVSLCDGSWESAYFVTMARNYGFGINGAAFEQWALSIPLHAVDHHRDDLFQIEAIFMGQAGLLSPDAVPERYREEAMREGYFNRLRNEYLYLAHKFSLQPIDYKLWRFLRLRPQNFPHIRIAQLANLYFHHKAGLSQLVDCKDIKAAGELLRTGVTPYWETHYTFGSPSEKKEKRLSPFSINLLLINTAIPMLFAYGRHKQDETLCDLAFDFLEQLKAENNHIVRMWQDCGLRVDNAGDSQALIQLKNEYCDRKECLRCRIGYQYLKGERRSPQAP
ncbi:MAG: DUF2851 family protein [Prevotella sp.]|nr:DUF2851 family protein [Prevotella sp.]